MTVPYESSNPSPGVEVVGGVGVFAGNEAQQVVTFPRSSDHICWVRTLNWLASCAQLAQHEIVAPSLVAGYSFNLKLMSHSRISNWPGTLRYSTKPVYHASVNQEARAFLQSGAVGSRPTESTPCKVIIRKIVDPAHPAHGQCGLFAGKKIPPNTFIVDYIGKTPPERRALPNLGPSGEVHCDDRPESDYDLSLHRFPNGDSVGIDASRIGNEARFTNDFRGVQKKPNAFFTDYRTSSGELRMCIKSREEIKKGEEILISYGKSWWNNRRGETGEEEGS